MKMIYTVRKKQVPPPTLWNISYLVLSDLQSLLLVLLSAALQPDTPILRPCMLQTHKYLSSFSVHIAKEWEHNTDITHRPQQPQNFLTSSRERQFPARQTLPTGEASQYQQQGNTDKNLCSAPFGHKVQNLK